MSDRALLNTLYVTTPEAYVHLDNDTICVRVDYEERVKVPLHHIGSVVTFGEVTLSSPLLQHLARAGISVVLLDRQGRFQARIEGPVSGNVMLRQSQYALSYEYALGLSRACVAGKVRNARQMVLRSARDSSDAADKTMLLAVSEQLARTLKSLPAADDIESVRGREGDAARVYFEGFSARIAAPYREAFALNGRVRRPPCDRTNAMLSFVYTLLTHDCRSALEMVGLDPQFGYLHTLRSGRPSLALDLMEEFRAIIADRLVLALINRQQIKADDFMMRVGGAVQMKDDARRTILVAYQERKKEEVMHPLLERTVPIGLLPSVQARLMARFIRGDMDTYLPFMAR